MNLSYFIYLYNFISLSLIAYSIDSQIHVLIYLFIKIFKNPPQDFFTFLKIDRLAFFAYQITKFDLGDLSFLKFSFNLSFILDSKIDVQIEKFCFYLRLQFFLMNLPPF